MNRPGRRRWKTYRWLSLSALSALVVGAACSGNPELSLTGGAVAEGAELGEPCERNRDCQANLLCGSDGVCVRSCGESTSDSCGDEACLPDGSCSEGLGDECDDDKDCQGPLLCSSIKRCSAPCEPGEKGQCKGDKTCRQDGTCETPKDMMLSFGGAGGEDLPGSGGAGNCIDVEVKFEPQVPTVLLLIDRSGSMNASGFGAAVQAAVDDGTYVLGDCPDRTTNNGTQPTNDWRWNVVREVLFNPERGIVKPLEDKVRFGLSLYSSQNGKVNLSTPDREDYDEAKMCPELIEVPIALGNHQAMFDEFKCSDISDDTPTGESLLAAAMTLQAFDEPGPKVIVLATDGEPDTCECPDFDNNNMPVKCREAGLPAQIQADVVAAAEQIYADDITIHVINVSTPSQESLQQHLLDVATAGGGEVYPGFSPGALSEAFDAIIDGVRSCVIDLDGEIADGKESTGVVTLDGEPLELDGDDGWQVNSPSQIELLGAACDAIKSGDHDLQVEFPCGSFEPVVH